MGASGRRREIEQDRQISCGVDREKETKILFSFVVRNAVFALMEDGAIVRLHRRCLRCCLTYVLGYGPRVEVE